MKGPFEDMSMHTAPWDVFLHIYDCAGNYKNPLALCSEGTMQNAKVEGC